MKNKNVKRAIVLIAIFFLAIFTAEGYLDIPQSAVGVVTDKEYKYGGNSDFGIFTIELENKKYPKKVFYDQMEYTAFEIGDRIEIIYKVPTIKFWEKPYGIEHKIVK